MGKNIFDLTADFIHSKNNCACGKPKHSAVSDCLKFLTFCTVLCILPVGLFAAQMPEWVHNKNAVYPETQYLSQLGISNDKEKSKTEAIAAISRYLKTSVESNLSTTFTSNDKKENISVVDETKISSDIELFGVQFTEPYYFKKQKKWYCIAFINRAQAWAQYQPVIEQEKTKFYSFFNKTTENPNLLEKVNDYKNAYIAGRELLKTLSFGRILNPVAEQNYKNDRENIALIPQLLSSVIRESSLYLDISQDYENIIKNAVSSQLAEYGFPIVNQKSLALYTVKVTVDTDAAYSDEIYSIYPKLSVNIIWQDTKSMFEYSCSKEKVAAYNESRVLKNGFSQLAEDINQNLKTKLNESFGF